MSWLIFSVIIPIVVIGVLIVVHEFGHFIVAKMCNIAVTKFCIGFGPAIFKKRFGETEYQLSCIPLGGYVRMMGDMPEAFSENETDELVTEKKSVDELTEIKDLPASLQDQSRWFLNKGFWARSAVVVAGPLFNLASAVLFVLLAMLIFGQELVQDSSIIGGVMKDSPAEKAGLKVGDKVLTINGVEVKTWEMLSTKIHAGTGEAITLDIERNNEQQSLIVNPQKKELKKYSGESTFVYLIGIQPMMVRKPLDSKFDAVYKSFQWTIFVTLKTCSGLWGMIAGDVSVSELSGPLFILGAAKQQAEKGLEDVLYFMALLSVSLAVLNLLPIPVLDGGHLFTFIVEAIIGPIAVHKKLVAQQVGLVFLLLLMGLAITNDIRREPLSSEPVKWEEK